MLSFMDAYFAYILIPMFHEEEEGTSFKTEHDMFYYKVMPFEFKNA